MTSLLLDGVGGIGSCADTSAAVGFLSSIQLRAVPKVTSSPQRGSPKSAAQGLTAGREASSSSTGAGGSVSAMSERLPSDQGGASSASNSAWMSHTACEFLSGLTLRSQAGPLAPDHASGGSPELHAGGGALDAVGALSPDAQLAGELVGVQEADQTRSLVVSGAAFSRLRHGGAGGMLPVPHDPVGSRVHLAPTSGNRPVLSFSVLRFRKEADAAERHGSRAKAFVSETVELQRRRQQQQQALIAQQQAERQQSQRGKLERQPSIDIDARPPKLKGLSYDFLLDSSTGDGDEHEAYDPFHLDDPALQSGKHRRVMNLPGFVESIIPFVRPPHLKQQLNEQFALKHPDIPRGLTLSKIRAIKRELLSFAQEQDCELSTVALAHVYFEKLVLRNVVNKFNRKLMAAVSLVLAAKWNEPKVTSNIFQMVEKHYAIPRAVIFRSEFSVYVELSFRLQLAPSEVYPHFVRLLQQLERTPHEYLGEAQYQSYAAEFLRPASIDAEAVDAPAHGTE